MSVNDLIHEVLAETPHLVDPGQVAERVSKRAPTRELRAMLADAVRDRARIVMSEQRLTALREVSRPAVSMKLQRRRDWWQAFLASSYHVDGVWKSAGDMGHEDWLVSAAEKRKIAARNISVAEREEKLAALILERGVTKTSELDEADVRAALGGDYE